MDMNILLVAVTIISFIVFVGILIWVWRNRNTSDFKDAANLPFKED
jgi:cytochrome c oxidase cbb3-type subunit 4